MCVCAYLSIASAAVCGDGGMQSTPPCGTGLICACLICVPYAYALRVCLMRMPYMCALCVCLICMPYVYALYVCVRVRLIKGTVGVPCPPGGQVKGSLLVVFWHKKGDILFGLGDSGQW